MRPSAALAERALSERIRHTWRLRAVDDDLESALGRTVLIAGKDLTNFGMELKHVDAGPLDLNNRQFDVLRRTRSDTPPFVFQFTAPPAHPWSFRLHGLREDSLEALGGHTYVTTTERETEAFTMALIAGASFPFTTTVHTPPRFRRTDRPNGHEGTCLACGALVAPSAGVLVQALEPGRPRWSVLHRNCGLDAVSMSSLEVILDDGEPAYYLAQFDDELVADDIWPEVIPPADYAAPPLQPSHTGAAASYLRAAGVFDRAPALLHSRPALTVVRQRIDVAERAQRIVAEVRAQRGEPVDDASVQRAVRDIAAELRRGRHSPWIDEAKLQWVAGRAPDVVARGVPGPFVGSDRLWHPIITAPATTLARQDRPTCQHCGCALIGPAGRPCSYCHAS
jgi:hypothetical protein